MIKLFSKINCFTCISVSLALVTFDVNAEIYKCNGKVLGSKSPPELFVDYIELDSKQKDSLGGPLNNNKQITFFHTVNTKEYGRVLRHFIIFKKNGLGVMKAPIFPEKQRAYKCEW